MLELKNITKTYVMGDTAIHALKGVSLSFRKSEFVSILGPSGCGKTTMLNIIGGLDRYGSGDLVIGGISTKAFKDADWDAYRNRSIGFVFQSYNLIGHQSILANVEIAMTLSGVSASERKERAMAALTDVGLADQAKKRPNQLSGGQMQRVAIARALVNNPEIILADEPTGALDTETSIQIMQILQKVAGDRLVIMVTHNGEMADAYSTRIVRLLDGQIISDTNPPESSAQSTVHSAQLKDKDKAETANAPAVDFAENERERKAKYKKTSMSFLTALSLSFKNLLTKKGRTIITAIAGSIGIIGVSLVLSLSAGMTTQVNRMQTESMANFPITIDQIHIDYNAVLSEGRTNADKDYTEFTDAPEVYPYQAKMQGGINSITPEFVSYLGDMPQDIYNTVSYTYSTKMNLVLKKADGTYQDVSLSSSRWQELPTNPAYVEEVYKVLQGRLPQNEHEVVVVTDTFNRLNSDVLANLGFAFSGDGTQRKVGFDDLLGDGAGKEPVRFKAVMNDDYWVFNESKNVWETAFDEDTYGKPSNIDLEIVGIVRLQQDVNASIFSQGLVYHPELGRQFYAANANSPILLAQQASPTTNVVTNKAFTGDSQAEIYLQWLQACQALGGAMPGTSAGLPTGIRVYPKDFDTKAQVKAYIDAYNVGKDEAVQIKYNDLMEVVSKAMTTMIDTISYALVAFAAISLVVSSIMIGIITYVSVIERTKEIGVLRSVGARKKDIRRVFSAETVIVGFAAGVIGVVIAGLLTIPINILVRHLVPDMGNINVATFRPLTALLMVALSIGLTLIAGFFPSRGAAKKDPVVALRTE
ncbi:MAG: ATP-binding cassette domain-containing protein [Clostridiales bacterium]|jgi:putative ABC transport system permease protein|nr:ATP-binding cassette domain-containing protein [Clostridiales bacterium]